MASSSADGSAPPDASGPGGRLLSVVLIPGQETTGLATRQPQAETPPARRRPGPPREFAGGPGTGMATHWPSFGRAPGAAERRSGRRMVDSGASLVQDGRRGERLELRVPITPTQLPAVRAMVGDLAMRMDYDLDAVEDLRLAVDEASAILSLVSNGEAPLTVVFETSRTGLHIEAWVPTVEGKEVPRDGFGWAEIGRASCRERV